MSGALARGDRSRGKGTAMLFRQLFDPESSTYTYLLADEATREAVILDPVLEQLPRDAELIRELGLRLVHALDTHVHADHVTALGALREAFGCETALSAKAGVGCADRAVREGDRVAFGAHTLVVRETPGHTNGCVTYVLDDARMAFTGDALLIRGSGRTDFQQGDARALYRSVREKIFTLPDDTLLYPAHDYKGRTVTTVGEEKRFNPRLGEGKSEDEFVDLMAHLALAYPKKIDVALPANLACGTPRGVRATVEPPPPSAWAPVATRADGTPELAPEWVAAHRDEVRVVDVRGPGEAAGGLGRVPGSELVPLDGLEATIAAWDREAPVVTVCRSGGRSAEAAAVFARLGFRKVASMRGGVAAWRALRLPVEQG
jgi:glyoxylase-like metal-dependent hydrolase (beta-lactamase superfamily II)/rhodanese-related sulfurtransferase